MRVVLEGFLKVRRRVGTELARNAYLSRPGNDSSNERFLLCDSKFCGDPVEETTLGEYGEFDRFGLAPDGLYGGG